MERRFSMNDFEKSLKEHADEFKMIPSKRVWHGIYNDLHPGRRWPSITMSLVLIFTLVVIGHLNTHTGFHVNNVKPFTLQSKDAGLQRKNIAINHKTTIHENNLAKNIGNVSGTIKKAEPIKDASPGVEATTNLSIVRQNNAPIGPSLIAQNFIETTVSPNSDSKEIEKNDVHATTKLNTDVADDPVKNNYIQNENFQLNKDFEIESANEKIIVDKGIYSMQSNVKTDNNTLSKNILTQQNIDKNISEKLVGTTTNKKPASLHRKKNEKINWVYFVSPELNSVSFSGQPIKPMSATTSSPAVAINQRDNKVLNNSALGFEAGTQLNYSITKRLKFTTGLQLNYSGYKILSNEVHPTFSTLILRKPETGVVYAKNYLTHYGDGTGLAVVSIRNYSLQASLPLGFQYQFLGNDKIQFNAGASIAPSYILKSNAYLLSSDGRNYINDPSLLRNWNMSSNFNLFVTFSSIKLKWQVGPDVRYQWFSTYKKDYTVQEHLIDYGIRIGISK